MSTFLQGKLTAKEASDYIGLSPNTILCWAKTGKLKHTKLGSRYFFDKKDISNMVTQSEPHNDKEQLS